MQSQRLVRLYNCIVWTVPKGILPRAFGMTNDESEFLYYGLLKFGFRRIKTGGLLQTARLIATDAG